MNGKSKKIEFTCERNTRQPLGRRSRLSSLVYETEKEVKFPKK